MARKPHIVIVNPDQWRGGVLGHLDDPAAITPHLDRLVHTDAVSFRNAFCQNPVCTPSRCSFMTGWYPHTRGHRTMFHMLQPDEPMLLRTLRENGYFVWWGGKNDIVPAQNGYEAFCDIKYEIPRPVFDIKDQRPGWRGAPGSDTYYSFYYGRIDKDAGDPYVYDFSAACVEGAIDLIRRPPTDQPLCIFLPLSVPHPPYAVEDPWYSRIDRASLPPRAPKPEGVDWDRKPAFLRRYYERQNMDTWTEDRWAELRATYYGMCARVDHLFGLVVEALCESGLYDDTAIFFFSDHGDYTGDLGLVEKTQNTFEDYLSRVPFVIKPPANVPVTPRISEALVELIDFPATVEALAGLAPTHTHFGRSLLPVLAGDTDDHRDAVFCQGGRLHGETQAMELLDNFGPEMMYWARVGVQHFEGPEHTKATMIRTREYKYVHRLYELDELYDLRADPQERRNRIDDPALAGVQAQLKDRLLRFYLETSDHVPFGLDRRW